ncbi:MAG TPA: VOC family protein [Chitinophaga sp.]|uniref:VOC family protein n=1 Tax=Chitinophaga sp. TaxID=1869181 RepID=UPI002C2BE5E8|nr:VOC family protein [Chitinophaga sp.]HVI44224.1 VOC family protein [Chitinophaga sp.]
MRAITTYFNFMGNTEEAMNFYKSVFGGEFTSFVRFGDGPGSENMPAHERNKIMNIILTTKSGAVLMATDFLESMEQQAQLGNNVHLVIHTDSEEEVDQLFNALSAGGKVEMPVNKTFWGAYFGMCEDRFGIKWMLNYDYPKNN